MGRRANTNKSKYQVDQLNCIMNNTKDPAEMIKDEINEENEGMERPDRVERTDVCRDFLKNICNRGLRCKFYHPEEIEHERSKGLLDPDYNFCIDYQNHGCYRDNCRFIHAQREDVELYRSTGEVSFNLARAISAVHTGDTINGIPFCKEFQNGACSRGASRCRYWHINVEEERERRRRWRVNRFTNMRRPYTAERDYYSVKRPRYDSDEREYIHELERKVTELKKEIEGLRNQLDTERLRYKELCQILSSRNNNPSTSVAAPIPPPQAQDSAYSSVAASYSAAANAAAAYYQSSGLQTNWPPRSQWGP